MKIGWRESLAGLGLKWKALSHGLPRLCANASKLCKRRKAHLHAIDI